MLDIQELGLLWARVLTLFTETDKVYATLTVELQDETLKFSTFSELEKFTQLPDRITKLSFWLLQEDRHISIRTFSGSFGQVSAGGESEAWCAGVVETVYGFLSNHRAPYSWFVSAPLGWIFLFVLYGIPLALFLIEKFVTPDLKIPITIGYSWVALLTSLSILYLARSRLFPVTVIRVRETRSFLQRNVAELSLAVAIVSLLITVVGWFVSK